jgi:hypothetical protein
MREAWLWAQKIQSDPWMLAVVGGGALAVICLILFIRIWFARLWAWVLSPKMKHFQSQIDAVWATDADLEKFGLINKKGARRWLSGKR